MLRAFVSLCTLLCVNGLTQSEINTESVLTCAQSGFLVYMSEELVHDGAAPGESFILYIGSKGLCNYTGTTTSGPESNTENIYRLDNGSYLFNFTPPDCGVERQYLGDTMEYDAVIGRDSYFVDGVSPMVTRISAFTINLNCIYNLEGTVTTAAVQVLGDPVTNDETSDGFLALTARLYKQPYFGADASYYTSFPAFVNEGKNLYVQIFEPNTAVGEAAYELAAENCTLSDSTDLDDPNTIQEDILVDNCPTNYLYGAIATDPSDYDVLRFRLPAVEFIAQVDQTYLTCSVVVCELEANDPTSICVQYRSQTCPDVSDQTRAKRSADAQTDHRDHQNYSYISRERLTLGQIRVFKAHDESNKGESVAGEIDSEGRFAIGGGSVCGAIAALGTAAITTNCAERSANLYLT